MCDPLENEIEGYKDLLDDCAADYAMLSSAYADLRNKCARLVRVLQQAGEYNDV